MNKVYSSSKKATPEDSHRKNSDLYKEKKKKQNGIFCHSTHKKLNKLLYKIKLD